MKLNHLRLICILICAAYLAACFWPFQFNPRNNTHWFARGNGLRLGWESIIFTEGEIDLGNAGTPAGQPGSMSIELWVTPESESYREIRSILSLYDANLTENLSLGEWRTSFLVRAIPLNSPSLRKYREVGVKDALLKGSRRFITVTSGPQGTAIYLDGVAARTFPKLLLRPESLRGRLVLGSSAEGRKEWNGSLHGLAAFNRTLDSAEVLRHYRTWAGPQPEAMKSEAGLMALYFFNEGRGEAVEDYSGARHPLVIPQHYQVLRKTVLRPPWREYAAEHLDFEDITINILGFIPFGFFYFIYRARLRPGRNAHSAVVTVIMAATLSLVIELTQVFLPMRDSSLTDWMSNTIGAFVGVAIAAVGKQGLILIERLQSRNQ